MSAPFFRQAGGKRELAPRIAALMPDPSEWSTYVEPFLGGGAVFFHLWNTCDYFNGKTAILGDADKDLAALYTAVRDDVSTLDRAWHKLVGDCLRSGDAKRFYLDQRNLWNAGNRDPARHLFLRHQSFNGLWRQNRKGEMNVPWRQEVPKSPGVELLHAMAALKGHEVLDWDFRQYEDDGSVFIGPRTLVYLDPPYLPAKMTGFTKYTAGGWNELDLVDLLVLGRVWQDRGAHVVMSHADTPKLRALVAMHWPKAEVHEVKARRSINSDGSGRGPVGEVILVGRVVA